MVVDMQSPEMQKLKRENYPGYRRKYLHQYLKNADWYCDVCNNGKNCSLRGKWSYLKTKKRERNYYAMKPLIKLQKYKNNFYNLKKSINKYIYYRWINYIRND